MKKELVMNITISQDEIKTAIVEYLEKRRIRADFKDVSLIHEFEKQFSLFGITGVSNVVGKIKNAIEIEEK